MRYFVFVLVGVFRRLLPVTVLGLIAGMFWQDLRQSDWSTIFDMLASIPVQNWVLGILATGASFWCLAQYDVLAHGVLNTQAPKGAARIGGACAIGIGQCTGFGPIVGGAVRYRILSQNTPVQIIALTAWVSTFFLISWFLIALCVALPIASGLGWLALPASLIALCLFAAALIACPDITLWGREIRLPSLKTRSQMLGLAFADLFFASLTLWIFLPADLAVSFPHVFAAYVMALGLGLIAGTPGGAGPFEMILLASLPLAENEAAIAGLLAFRIAYYALPGFVSTCAFFTYQMPRKPVPAPHFAPFTKFDITHPEHAIAIQSSAITLADECASAPALQTRNTLALFRQTTTGSVTDLLPKLAQSGAAMGKIPCLYKISAKDATSTRKRGWAVFRISHEAYLMAQDFTLDGADKRQLRRMLRKAEKANVVTGLITQPDWPSMDRIDQEWRIDNGPPAWFNHGEIRH